MTKIISFINHKGGVGKTTSTQNIAVALAKKKKRVLVIDFDPQANLTIAFLVKETKKTISDLITDYNDFDFLSKKEGVDIIPADLNLAVIEQTLISKPAREHILKNKLSKIQNNYDYILIDCPPALNIFTYNSLTASDYCFIPLQTETFAYKGIEPVLNAVGTIKELLNSKLEAKIFFTRTKEKGVLSNLIQQAVKENKELQGLTFKTKIRENIKLSEAVLEGKSIFSYAPKSNGAIDYKNLTNEIINL